MLTKQACQERIGQLLERTRGGCGAIIIADPRHIGYLSGFFTNLATINLRSQSFLMIEPDGRSTLITDNWQAEAARASHVDAVEVFDWYIEEWPARERRALAVQSLSRCLRQTPFVPRVIGIERNTFMVEASDKLSAEYPGLELRDVWDDLVEMRRCKYPDEVESVKLALKACEAGYAAVRQSIEPGLTELDIYSIAYRAALLNAGEPISAVGDFISVVARTAAAAGPPTRRVMQSGELMIMDFFVLLNGYRVDLCNTFAVGRRPDQEQQRRFAVLEKALRAAEEKLHPGTTTREIYQTVGAVIAEGGLGEGFWGHVGHGLGLDHPEAPFIVRESDELLQPGNVIAVEPGFYLKDWGGMRIEDDYLITGDGFERLSHHVKGL
jgi:Xaa-Pro dipeptidase